jgi:hypothetical protein
MRAEGAPLKKPKKSLDKLMIIISDDARSFTILLFWRQLGILRASPLLFGPMVRPITPWYYREIARDVVDYIELLNAKKNNST